MRTTEERQVDFMDDRHLRHLLGRGDDNKPKERRVCLGEEREQGWMFRELQVLTMIREAFSGKERESFKKLKELFLGPHDWWASQSYK